MKKRAFTLIELLVVIAIIAILAAILFPVFAQAKLAAKQAASLSNVKQLALSNLIYANDYDDNFVIATQDTWNDACGLACSSGGGHCFNNYTVPALDWDSILEPYVKSLGLYVDPGTGDSQGVLSNDTSPSGIANFNGTSQYGYNYLWLAPIAIIGTTGGWVSGPLPTQALGRSQTAAVHATLTPMFQTAQSSAPPTGGLAGPSGSCGGFGAPHGTSSALGPQTGTPDDDFLNAPCINYQELWALNRLEIIPGDTTIGSWLGGWVRNDPYGISFTGESRMTGPYNGGLTSFVDGHAKVMSIGQAVVGTDYPTSNTTEYKGFNGTGSGCMVTNVANYVWNLDGTMADAGNPASSAPTALPYSL